MLGRISFTSHSLASEPAETFPLFGHQFGQLFGHQGGWDEVLLVAIPLTIIGGLLWIANRRVNAQLQDAETSKIRTNRDNDAGPKNNDDNMADPQ